MLSKNHKTFAVAGTHGKTSVSTMIAHILNNTEEKCMAFLGGISKNTGTNFLAAKSENFVAEADEYDRSFLQLSPNITVITSIDPDHLDIYGTYENILSGFQEFVSKIEPQGTLIHNINLPTTFKEDQSYYTYTYSLDNAEADFFAGNIRLTANKFHFDVFTPTHIIKNLELGAPGLYNVENAVAAIAACTIGGAPEGDIKKAVKSFQGIQRRFDIQYMDKAKVYIDDYAHHPTEIEKCVDSARKMFPGKKITGIFQPHLFSRTRDFAVGFAESLDKLDTVYLLDIYPAREKPIEGVNSKLIFNMLNNKSKYLCSLNNFPKILNKTEIEVLITMGAGDIGLLTNKIKEFLKQ